MRMRSCSAEMSYRQPIHGVVPARRGSHPPIRSACPPALALGGSTIPAKLKLVEQLRDNSMGKSRKRISRGRDRSDVARATPNCDAEGHVAASSGAVAAAPACKRARPNPVATVDATKPAGPVEAFPFPTEEDDHCESPLEAYAHITYLLKRLELRGGPGTFTIYDPYYCNGSVVRHLKQLGFDNVYNRKEDCYERWKSAPSGLHFDVLVTNPPYSGDHIQRLVEYATSGHSKPFFLLLPNWVVKKDYYQACTRHIRPFYLVPHKRYVYVPPKDFRATKKSDTHKKSAPFVSLWYCWGGDDGTNEQLIRLFYQQTNSQCDLARSKNALRDLRRKKK